MVAHLSKVLENISKEEYICKHVQIMIFLHSLNVEILPYLLSMVIVLWGVLCSPVMCSPVMCSPVKLLTKALAGGSDVSRKVAGLSI